jgi:UrcA family protein
MNTTSKFNFRYRSLLGVCMLVTAAAWANPPSSSITVSYRDLDLSNSAGVARLYRRIQGAAQSVCGYDAASVFGPSIWKNCVRPTVDATVAKVNNPLLTALHTGSKPSPATAMINK